MITLAVLISNRMKALNHKWHIHWKWSLKHNFDEFMCLLFLIFAFLFIIAGSWQILQWIWKAVGIC